MIAYLTQYISPVALQPFYIFELFIGGIQAYIFFMLSTVFISLGLQHHGDDEEKNTHLVMHSDAQSVRIGASE
jgi:F-type H+-transporting ATPase subunit a